MMMLTVVYYKDVGRLDGAFNIDGLRVCVL